MKNKNVRGIIALAVVTALSFGVIMGSKALAKDMGTGASNTAEEQVKEEIDTKGAEGIEKAVKTENGYMVTAKVKGYGGDIVMNVSFDAEKKKVTKVEVTEQKETEGLGAKVADAEFLSQFEGVEAPVFLPGMSLEKEEKVSDEELLKELKDGTYEAKADAPDNNGFTDVVTVTVKDGKIAEVNWEAVGADGSTKSVLSENGEYVMTEDGLTWKEQAEALAKAVVENQSLSFLNLDEQGKTDAVSGVSISIGGFTALAEKCLKEAAGITQTLELKDGTYEAKAEEMLLPIVESHGFELVDVEYVKEGGTWYLRAYIDKEGGITVDDCEIVSRAFSDRLDAEDFIDDAYIMEVSSPGLGRPLKKEKDYKRSMGKELEIRTYRAIERNREFYGILTAYDDNSVTILEEDGTERVFQKSDIALIRLAFDF